MVLGKLPVPGRPTIWITVGQGPTALAVGAGGGCLDILTLIYLFSPLSPSLWETARYRLKYCLKGPLNPKQPTNQPTKSTPTDQIFFAGLYNQMTCTIKSDNCKFQPTHDINVYNVVTNHQFQSMSGRLPERGRKRREKDRRE